MGYREQFRRCLETGDAETAWRLWVHIFPKAPQPKTLSEAEATLHYARTQVNTLPFKGRAYSHAWLTERGMPSGLPDKLKPKAERMYPRIVDAVGVACSASTALMKPIVKIVQGAMSDAVLEAYADKRTDPVYVKQRIMEARARTIKRLMGTIAAQ